MKIIVVHPDKTELVKIKKVLKALHPDYRIEEFTDPMLAFQYAFNHVQIDALFTLIEMKRLDGFTLARMMREDKRKLSINFCSYDEHYRRDAEKFGCDTFISLPMTLENLQTAEAESVW